jgi:glutathione S-transferase
MSLPLLWHFPISHYNEKARWALDWKRIPHRRKILSASYLPRAWWATGRATLPVLHLGGRAIGDSTRIIAALEEHSPEPPLYSEDPVLRERALAIEDFFDEEVGHPVRTLLVPGLMETGPHRITETLMHGMTPAAQRAFRVMHPVFKRFYYHRHGIADESRTAAPDAVRSGFDRVEAELGSRDYLVGDRFGVADLTAAAILAPIVRPKGTLWAELGEMPEPVEAFARESAQRPSFDWVNEMYSRHRGESAERV